VTARAERPWLAELVRGVVAWVVIGLIWGNIWTHLLREYDRTLAGAMETTTNLARVFEAMTIRTIDAVDQVLLLTRDLYTRAPTSFDLTGWARDTPFLNDLAIQIAVADETGRVVASNLGLTGPTVSIADRAHFRVHADGAGDSLFISQPVIGRVSGRMSVQFVRPVRQGDGRFRGVVVASLDPRMVSRLYGSVDIAEGYTILLGLDGIPRAGSPEDLFAATLPDPSLPARVNAAANGSYRYGDGDASGAIVGFRRVGGHDLVVAVGRDIGTVLARYKDERTQYLLIGAGLTLFVLVLQLIDFRYRRRVGRFQQALTVTLENMSQGIVMIDREGRVAVINHRTAELLGLPTNIAHEGASFWRVLSWQAEQGEFAGDEQARVQGLLRDRRLAATASVHERARPDGTILEVRTKLLPDGAAVRTFTDITERKRFEREIADARDAAEAGSRVRSEFLAVMSHEIRTPLNGILGAAGLMRGLTLEPEVAHYARIIQEAGSHLLVLVDDILDFASLDTGRLVLEPAPFDLPGLLGGVAGMLRSEAAAKRLTLTLDADPNLPDVVIGDAGRLRQVLVNLVDNAIKFTHAGGVRVTARAIRDDTGHLSLAVSVQDTGIGIPPENRARLFEAFTQSDGSLSRRFAGAGLGLAICHRLISLMHGSIHVESTPGEGSTFHFAIPLRLPVEPATHPSMTETDAGHGGEKLRVLVAEDNPTNRLVATRMVSRLGHHVDAVEDGAEAVASLRRSRYDVVLMDLMMPGMDGITATRTIRAEPAPLATTPIIGLTANAHADDEAACLAAGMDAFLTKPVSVERLSSTLRAVVAAAETVAASSLSPPRQDRYPDAHPG
jgi:signal transduction histidine kinase/CheY-like chemotaxis protein